MFSLTDAILAMQLCNAVKPSLNGLGVELVFCKVGYPEKYVAEKLTHDKKK